MLSGMGRHHKWRGICSSTTITLSRVLAYCFGSALYTCLATQSHQNYEPMQLDSSRYNKDILGLRERRLHLDIFCWGIVFRLCTRKRISHKFHDLMKACCDYKLRLVNVCRLFLCFSFQDGSSYFVHTKADSLN